MVFTAGAMGSGKSWTMHWLQERGYFPLESFVVVDPDAIRYQVSSWTALGFGWC